MAQGRPAEDTLCPLDVKSTKTSRGVTDGGLEEEEAAPGSGQVELTWDLVAMEASECSDVELGQLDLDLDRKSRQHNLTSRNVRAILHEVITHEHVVAMMKATIRDTQDLPMFETKMTRSRLKQAVQQGQSLNWTLPAPNLSKPPQFVDIDLEEEEDSSDEEYCPDEEEEDTAEEMFLSDADSLASPPRMHLCSPPEHPDQETREPQESVAGQVTDQVSSSSGAGSSDSSFLERLNAVEAELDCSSAYPYNQPLDRKPVADEEDGGDKGCLAFRTRSKLPLVNVPLDRLEAELLPPDITADMYDQSPAQLEDRHWTEWLQGLLAPSPEEEADDDDDPEYNFLEDLDEPDREDYRTDRAVQITKKEVNELLEELFDTLQEEELLAEEEEQEVPSVPKFNVPQVLRFEAPLAGMLTERRQTVRKQYEAVQQRRALQDTTNHPRTTKGLPGPPLIVLGNLTGPALRLSPAPKTGPSFRLDRTQKLQLQQQVQQHVQLLTQVHLLSRRVHALNHEAHLTKRYLEELQHFAGRHDDLCPSSHFRACNLQGALDLLREVDQRQPSLPCGSGSGASRRLLPTMIPTTSSHAFPLLPADAAWLFATRPVFLYPELLPVCSLDPAKLSRRQRRVYTAGEDGLAVLGLKHFQGALKADQLISSFLLCRSCSDFRRRIREMSGPRAPRDGVIKVFVTQGVIPPLPVACSRVCPGNQRPPVDRDTSTMPRWLKNSQSIIQRTRRGAGPYPPSLPPGVALRLHPSYGRKSQVSRRTQRRLFTLAHNASLLPLAKAPAGQAISRSGTLPLAAPRPSRSLSLRQDIQQKSAPTMVFSAAGQQLWTLSSSSQHAAGPDVLRPIRRQEPESCALPPEEDRNNSSSSLSPFSSSAGDEEEEEEEEVWSKMAVGLKGGGRGGAVEGGAQERTADEAEQEELDGDGEEEEDDEDGGREDRGGEREDNGDKDRRGDDEEEEEEDDEEEEEEDFDDLTQDEDEEEVMSSASEESVLSVPELQETMKQLTWLAAERRLCDGDSEDDPSSQEDEDEEDDEAKGEEPAKGRSFQTSLDKDMPSGDKTPRGRRGAGRGRGRSRPLRGLARTRLSKDASKLSLLYDEKLLDNDPLRDSKDAAFAQSYLNRVREALQDSPEQVQEFVSLLGEFEQAGDGQEVTSLFRKLRCILGEHTDLLRDFAAFLHPEQALQCGLFEEQQAFERSRRFLRQLEISFGDNPTHYHKIIRALQTGPDPSPAHIQELKVQMAALLRGHTHLQAEFWVFFDDLRPPAARPEQFEEAHLPEEGDGAEGGGANGQVSRGGAGFEEVTLPDLEEEEEGHKIPPIRSRRQRRKMESHHSYKGSDWLCLCHDASISRHRRKRCSRCHDNKTSPGVSRALKSLDPLYAQIGSAPDLPGDTQLKGGHGSPRPDQSATSWESFPMTDEKEEEEEQLNDEEQESPTSKRRREEELRPPAAFITADTSSSSVAPPICSSSSSPRPSLPPDLPVCAKNISLTASGEKVILWTREADRVILTMCQQEGANQNAFQAISNLLGNKTPSEVSQRFRDLMRLFRTAARHATAEEEALPTDPTANETAD
ncbi:GON-4-like protein isoform X1 [Poecilia latipinna]|uniref:GON-4-like protein isoform X1 n=1 Tax=Poecilia latipinna TaxID=48699 RepID=UPI00072ED51C|nr:PREDICTED: GON-4-like protein isoform X1 [Poecilia latipinna]XP_014879264.1 PREDICTED: GON-4-like protein isoform X1 [Poecilia latipinna]